MPLIHPGRYGAFACVVSYGGTAVGGFSMVSGLEPGRPPGAVHVVLKRGRVSGEAFLPWIRALRADTAEGRPITITVFDAARRKAAIYVLRNARPSRWTGPPLAAKGGGDVAMEELELTAEGIEPD